MPNTQQNQRNQAQGRERQEKDKDFSVKANNEQNRGNPNAAKPQDESR